MGGGTHFRAGGKLGDKYSVGALRSEVTCLEQVQETEPEAEFPLSVSLHDPLYPVLSQEVIL